MSTNGTSLCGEKVLHAPDDQLLLDRFAASLGEQQRELPRRIVADPERIERDLARLVLGVVELVRQLLERQAVRRVESGVLSDTETERLGLTLLRLEARMGELKEAFGLKGQDLTVNLGPLRDLISDCDEKG